MKPAVPIAGLGRQQVFDGSRLRRPGGSSGGLGTFLAGFAMAVAGGYLFLDRVQIIATSWSFFGFSSFGLPLIPLLIGVLSHLGIFFRPTSLFETQLMLILLVAAWRSSSNPCAG
jgi:hypothetical protein